VAGDVLFVCALKDQLLCIVKYSLLLGRASERQQRGRSCGARRAAVARVGGERRAHSARTLHHRCSPQASETPCSSVPPPTTNTPKTKTKRFSTGAQISSSDALIQEFYSKEASSGASASAPARAHVHLVVDTSLTRERVGVAAYVSRVLALGDKALATEFVEVPCDVPYADVERVGVDLLVSGSTTAARPLSDQDGLGASIARLQALVSKARAYVDAVQAGAVQGDPAIGRYLADTLAAVPALEPADFERLFNEGVQDALLLDYLAALVRSQVSLAERLGTAALPIL
jgi:hypothetical protein